MTDITPWAVDLSFADLDSTGFKGVLGGLFGGSKGVDAVAAVAPAGEVFKQVPLYGANAPLPLKKTLSITRSTDFEASQGGYSQTLKSINFEVVVVGVGVVVVVVVGVRVVVVDVVVVVVL